MVRWLFFIGRRMPFASPSVAEAPREEATATIMKMADGTPYRTMPLPAAPRVSLRRQVERGLGVFNLAVLALLTAARFSPRAAEASPHVISELGAHFYPLGAVLAAVAVYGFLGRGTSRLRAWLTLASGIAWLAWTPLCALGLVLERGYDANLHRAHRFALGPEIGFMFVLVVVGLLTFESWHRKTRT